MINNYDLIQKCLLIQNSLLTRARNSYIQIKLKILSITNLLRTPPSVVRCAITRRSKCLGHNSTRSFTGNSFSVLDTCTCASFSYACSTRISRIGLGLPGSNQFSPPCPSRFSNWSTRIKLVRFSTST